MVSSTVFLQGNYCYRILKNLKPNGVVYYENLFDIKYSHTDTLCFYFVLETNHLNHLWLFFQQACKHLIDYSFLRYLKINGYQNQKYLCRLILTEFVIFWFV